MGGGWLVGAKNKDQQGLMKDRVREGYGERWARCRRDWVREGQGERANYFTKDIAGKEL